MVAERHWPRWSEFLACCILSEIFGEGSHGGEETAVPAIGNDQQQQQQHSMGQISRLLGRPKCFSRREDEWHDWSLKVGAIAATLSDHAIVRMNGGTSTRYGDHGGSTR